MTKVRLILQDFSIHCIKYSKINKGFASKKWLIISGDNKKYILKEIKEQNINRINDILTIQSRLNAYAPKVIKTIDGKLYTKYDGCHYYLCEYIVSEKFDLKNHLYDIGSFLGRLHKKMLSIKKIGTTFLKLEDNQKKLEELLEFYTSQDNKSYTKIIEYKLEVIRKFQNISMDVGRFKKQIIHGDFYISNVLLSESYIYVVDFDQCCMFFKEYEVVRSMMMIFYKLKLKTINFNYIKEFVKGYLAENNIKHPKDSYYLYLYIQAHSLSSVKISDSNIESKQRFAMKRYKILKFFVDNESEIIRILGGE